MLEGANLGNLRRLRETRLLCILVLIVRWESWAFLAAWVLAVDTDLVRAKGGVAAMTGTAYAHADRLGDSRKLQIGRRLPLAGFEGEAIFEEERTGLCLLRNTIVG